MGSKEEDDQELDLIRQILSLKKTIANQSFENNRSDNIDVMKIMNLNNYLKEEN